MRHAFWVGGIAIWLAVLVLLPSAASGRPTSGPIVVTFPNPGGVPTLTVSQTGPGQVTASWTTPRSDDGSTNLHWDTSNATTPWPANSPAEGAPLNCWLTGPSDGVHGCTGGADQGDASRKDVVSGLAPGTYWFQIEVEGLKDEYINGNPSGQIHYPAYSIPVSVVVTAKGGGTNAGGQSGGSGTDVPPPRRVVIKGEAWYQSGVSKPQRVSGPFTITTYGDALWAGKKAIELAVKEGRLILGPRAGLMISDVAGDDNALLVYGEAWFSGARYKVVCGNETVRTIGTAIFDVVQQGTLNYSQAVVQVESGKVDVGSEDGGKHVLLTAGYQTIVPGSRKGPPKAPTRFTPPAKPFWKK